MIAIIDYGAGNLKSVEKALVRLGAEPVITRDQETILGADHIILPGVGAFGDAMANLEKYGLDQVIREAVERQIPFLGICLGLQLLFEESEETPGVKGLGILKGKILRIPDQQGLKIPHMGWNSLHYDHKGRLFENIPEDVYVYFVHSYYLKAEEEEIVKASTFYSTTIHASVEKGNVFACQFHPEKSSEWGLKILENFIHIPGARQQKQSPDMSNAKKESEDFEAAGTGAKLGTGATAGIREAAGSGAKVGTGETAEIRATVRGAETEEGEGK